MDRIAEAAGALSQALAGLDPAGLSGSQALELVETLAKGTQVLARFDLGNLSGWQAVELVETLAHVEKVCAAARTRAAARVEESGAYRAKGHRSGAQWLAKTMGTSPSHASATIETAKTIEGLAATKQAFAAGRLSEAQATEVAKAAAVDPSAEADLLETAQQEDWRSLKDRARQVRLNAEV